MIAVAVDIQRPAGSYNTEIIKERIELIGFVFIDPAN